MTGSSITISFHSTWGKETYLKPQQCSKFHRCASLNDRVFELIQAKVKVWVIPYKFCRSFNIGCGFAYHAKSWLQLRTNTVHYHFCFLKSRQLLYKSVIRDLYSKLAWKRTDHLVFSAVEGIKEKLFARKVWGLRSRWSSILRPPKHRFMFFLSILSAKEVTCPF